MREHAVRLARLAQVLLHVAGVAAPPPRAALTGEAIDAIGACASMLTWRRTALVHVGSTRAPAISFHAVALETVFCQRAGGTVHAWGRGASPVLLGGSNSRRCVTWTACRGRIRWCLGSRRLGGGSPCRRVRAW